MEAPEHVWFLMARNLSGEATTEEQRELMELLQQQPQWMQQYDLLKTMWKPLSPDAAASEEPENVRNILQRAAAEEHLQEAEEAPVIVMRRGYSWRSLLLRAAVVLGLGISVWVYTKWAGNDTAGRSAYQEIVAHRGSKTRTILPDGSTVWLNAGSRLVYPTKFGEDSRQVTLQGEAFFDVVKQTGRPFIVHAADIDITVLGTAFNVKSYSEDNTIETTLIRGLVQITRKNEKTEQPILLRPNQKLVLHKSGHEGEAVPGEKDIAEQRPQINKTRIRFTYIDSTKKENELVETAWVYNRLEFRGDPFPELGRKLERWYNISVHFEDEQVKQLTFNGSLENETVEQAFQALKAAVPFGYEIIGNEVYVRSGK